MVCIARIDTHAPGPTTHTPRPLPRASPRDRLRCIMTALHESQPASIPLHCSIACNAAFQDCSIAPIPASLHCTATQCNLCNGALHDCMQRPAMLQCSIACNDLNLPPNGMRCACARTHARTGHGAPLECFALPGRAHTLWPVMTRPADVLHCRVGHTPPRWVPCMAPPGCFALLGLTHTRAGHDPLSGCFALSGRAHTSWPVMTRPADALHCRVGHTHPGRSTPAQRMLCIAG
jgi:hypothetical protein